MDNKIDILNNYSSFSWDFDKILVDGINSTLFRSFILNNPDKTHYILTFRDVNDFVTIEKELNECYHYPLDINLFDGVFKIPENFLKETNHLKNKFNNKFYRVLERENISFEAFFNIKENLYSWKAKKSKDLNSEILIDDLEKNLQTVL